MSSEDILWLLLILAAIASVAAFPVAAVVLIRDKTPERICRSLCAIGVPATMAKGGGYEEDLDGKHPFLSQFLPDRKSDLIDIAEGPIRWVNVGGESGIIGLSDRTPYGYCFVEYAVPDARVLPEVSIRPVFLRSRRVFGRITAVRWKGNDGGLRIVDHLNDDDSVNRALRANKRIPRRLSVSARPQQSCWTITDSRCEGLGLPLPPPAPSAELWRCYQTIAGHLLAEWDDVGEMT